MNAATRDDMNAAEPDDANAPATVDGEASVPTGAWTSHGPAETFDAGRRVGHRLAGGEVLLLSGTLGAGKTVFTKGLAAGLGLDPAEVSSPSFTLVNRHDGGRLVLYHLDLYRLAEGPASAHAVRYAASQRRGLIPHNAKVWNSEKSIAANRPLQTDPEP